MSEPIQHLCGPWNANFANVRLDRMSATFIRDFQEHRIFCPVCQEVQLNQYIMQHSLSYASAEQRVPVDLLDPLIELLAIEQKQHKDDIQDGMPAKDTYVIAMQERLEVSSVSHVYFGYYLMAVNPNSQPNRLSMQGLFLARLSFLRDAFPGVSFAMQLKHIYMPNREENQSIAATILLFRFSEWRYTPAELRAKALDFNNQIQQLLDITLPDFRFAQITDVDELQRLLDPFPVQDVAEIRRSSQLQYTIPNMYAGIPDIEVMMDLMLGQLNAVELAITIEPSHLDNMLNSLNNQDVSPAMDTHSYEPITSSHMNERIGGALQNPVFDSSSLGMLQQRIQSLRTHAFAVRIHVASDGRLSDALLATINSEFGGPSKLLSQSIWQNSINPAVSSTVFVRPRTNIPTAGVAQFDCAVENGRVLATIPWDGDPPSIYLCDLGETTRLFALPLNPSWIYDRGIALTLPYNEEDQPGIKLGINKHHNKIRSVVQPFDSRIKHTWIIGQTGTGKSTLLENMIQQDIERGSGVIVIDPHGEMLENVIGRIPPERMQDVIYFDPADTDRPMGFNIIQAKTDDERALVVSSMIQLIQKMFDPNYIGIVGPRFEHNVRNALLSILYVPEGTTLIEMVRILTDDDYMRKVLPYITDPIVKRYWTDQIAHTSDFHRSEIIDWLVSKFGRFVTDFTIRRIIGQANSSFSFRKAMDDGKIVLLSLAKGKVGAANANFLGLIMLPMILQAALSRANIAPHLRRECTLYIDEFHNYATESLALMLAESRKYKLSLVLANQHVRQLTDDVRDALYGNAGNIISFRVGAIDAEIMERLLDPSPITPLSLMNLPDYTAYARVLVNNRRSPAFVLNTELPSVQTDPIVAQQVRSLSRSKYGRDREEVEREILKRSNMG